jgi:hypothetical protein
MFQSKSYPPESLCRKPAAGWHISLDKESMWRKAAPNYEGDLSEV